MSPNQLFVWKSRWKYGGWAQMLGGAEPQGITKLASNNVSQVDGVSDTAPACQLFGGGLKKGKNGLQLFCL